MPTTLDIDFLALWPAFLIAALIFVVPVLLDRGALTAISTISFGMVQVLIGHAIIDEFFDESFWPSYALSAVLVIAGYYTTSGRFRPGNPVEVRTAPTINPATVVAFVTVVSCFVVYHFIVGGIPLLSSDIEVKRFDFASSGLFGIPGRMYLFGLPFIVAYASFVAHRYPSKLFVRLRAVVWTEYVLAMVFSGFKGSLVVVFTLWLLIRSMNGAPIRLKVWLRPRLLAGVFIAISFGALIAKRYPSLELDSGESGTVTYLAQRVTVIAAAPGAFAVRALDPAAQGYYFTDDFIYFVGKYFGIHLSSREVFPIDKVISSQLTGTPLDETEFVVSVTPGAFVCLLVDFGTIPALFLMFCVGMLHGSFRARAQRAISPFRFASHGLVLLGSEAFILKGMIAYYLINVSLMLVMLGAIHLACERVVAARAHAST